jgi:hypothetical protein
MKKLVMLSAVALTLVAASPAGAAPNPNPAAPDHAQTASANVIGHNPQAGPGTHSAPPAQENFAAVGAAFCGL